jgi:hypothetical protein
MTKEPGQMLKSQRNVFAGIVALAAATAAAGSTYFLRRTWRQRRADGVYEGLEVAVVDALCADDVAGACPIDVAALGPGIIELSGNVPDEAAGARAAEVAGRVDGVHTVVNRVTVERVERHLAETRRRRAAGEAQLSASGWEGLSSGMGSGRQGEQTEPSASADAPHMVENAIGADDDGR